MAAEAPILPSDSLARWREFFASHPHLNLGFAELAQVPVVIDASAALADLRSMVLRPDPSAVRSALEEVVASGTVVAFAPPWLREEVAKKLPRLAMRSGVSLAILSELWVRYQSALRFYEPSPARDIRVDPKDIPYRDLARELGGILVYTKDRHFKMMGVRAIGLDEIILLRNFARGASPAFALKFVGAAALMIVGVPVVQVLKTVLGVIGRLPAPIKIGLAIATVWAAFHPKTREFLGRAAASPRLGPAKKLLTKYADELGKSSLTAAESWRAFRPALPDRRRAPLLGHVRAICASTNGPVSEQAIETALQRAGYVSRSRNPGAYLRRRLRTDSRFVEGPKGSWSFASVRPGISPA